MQKQNYLINTLAVCVKWRKIIFWQVLLVCIITIGLLFIVPEWYRSTAKIIPATEEENSTIISSLISQLPIPSNLLGMAGASGNATLSMAILESRTIMEATVNRFGLVRRYKAKDIEKAAKILRKRSHFELDDEGTISISFTDRTRYFHSKSNANQTRILVRNITNNFVSQLDSMNRNLLNRKARDIRQFYEKRYAENMDTLKVMENAFRRFQEKNGTIALPEQTIATIQAAAQLKADIISKEIETGILKQYFGSNNFTTIKNQSELDGLRGQYESLFLENALEPNKLLPAFQKIPSYGLEYARYIRDIKVREILVTLLLQQLEQARLQELKDTPTIQILDSANLPIKRDKPRRAITLILTFLFSFLFSTMLALSMERIREMNLKKSGEEETIRWMIREFKGDINKLRFRKQ